jgi:hypothetical protein
MRGAGAFQNLEAFTAATERNAVAMPTIPNEQIGGLALLYTHSQISQYLRCLCGSGRVFRQSWRDPSGANVRL